MTPDGLLRQLKKRNCFIIAHYYKDGLAKGKWTTQKGALNALGVSQAELSLALKVAALPTAIVNLFESATGVTPYSVRVIREVIARDGLQTVFQRIGEHVAAGRTLPARAVLATINGQGAASRRALRYLGNPENKVLSKTLDSPKNISDRYHLGVTRGEWTTYSGCARALDISRKNMRDAVYLMALRDSLPVSFSEAELTFAVGRKLLALDKELGRQALLQRVRNLSPGGSEATPETVLRELNGVNVLTSDHYRIRIRKGRGTRRLIIECIDAGALLPYRRDIERAIRKVVKRVTVSPEEIEVIRSISNDREL
ncbi:hypothetical protein PQR11_24180 [Paraburkholderia strydomiana]|uniref:hypothetical protein n=1 Tax=Paraburkholderia strydomiana TaxID=1245417 RepID=UPI0038B6FA79